MIGISRPPQHRLVLILLFPVLISGLGAAIAYLDAFQEFRDHAMGGAIPDELVSSGRTGKELRLLEYRSLADINLEGFDKYLDPEDMPSTTLLSETAAETGLPTLSVSINPEYLVNKDTGLLQNYQERGRSWERPAYMSYFESGELQLGSGVGLRVHGGTSRAHLLKSFRLYFRELYGKPHVSSDTFFGGVNGSLNSIIVNNDVRNAHGTDWRFMNPIAYELAIAIGCIAPDTRPVKFYINGEYQGPYVLTEHISDGFLKRRFGHAQFVLARMKTNQRLGDNGLQKGNPQLFEEYRSWPASVIGPMTVEAVEEMIDLDSLTNWAISILYVGTTDPFQGAVILDETDPNARWQYINWDMDHAFMDLYDQVTLDWEIDNFGGNSALLDSKATRSKIFNRLRQESPEYRTRFLSRIVEVLNHVLTTEKVGEIIGDYEKLAKRYEMADTSFFHNIAEFTKLRPAALRKQLDEYFDAGTAYRLTISSQQSGQVTVDGYDVGTGYSGWYFYDTPVNIKSSSFTETNEQFLIINGMKQPFNNRDLTINLSKDTEIIIR